MYIIPFVFVHVGFHFASGQPPTAKLEELFNSAREWARYDENCWILYTSTKPNVWRDRIRQCEGISPSDSFFLCIFSPGDCTGYQKEIIWDWFKKLGAYPSGWIATPQKDSTRILAKDPTTLFSRPTRNYLTTNPRRATITPMPWPFQRFSTKMALQQILERTNKIMVTLEGFMADVKKYQGDVTAALGRAQATLDDLKTKLTSAGLTAEQQAALDAADAAVNAADAAASGFDVPTA